MPLPAAFLAAIAAGFPADFASTEASDLTEYGRDWTKVFTPAPSLVAFPRTTDEVSRFLSLASEHGVAVVPSGGRTGLAAGAVAGEGDDTAEDFWPCPTVTMIVLPSTRVS